MGKPDLRVHWSKRESTYKNGQPTPGALIYSGEKSTGGMLAYYFENMKWPGEMSLAEELDARGYDLSTLRFQIRKKAP